MNLSKITFLLLLTISTQIFPQNIKFELFPEGQNFMPLKASHQEAKMGILYYPENGYLKVDIGNSSDLLAFSFRENDKLTFAIDFMAYALSTNYSGKRLQIAVLDGFFGGHGAYRLKYDDRNILMRFRIIHNSAHFVDGLWDATTNNWIGDDKPIPFTQDFGEITIADEHIFNFGSVKYYSSIAYATMVRPTELEKWFFNAGFEVNSNQIFGNVLGKPVNLFLASHNVLAGKPNYQITSNNMFGIKFGDWYGKGLAFYLSYYNGNHVFSEYYFKRVSQFGIGFSVDFF